MIVVTYESGKRITDYLLSNASDPLYVHIASTGAAHPDDAAALAALGAWRRAQQGITGPDGFVITEVDVFLD